LPLKKEVIVTWKLCAKQMFFQQWEQVEVIASEGARSNKYSGWGNDS